MPKIQKLVTIFIRINLYKLIMKNVAISRMSTEAANSAECGQDESQK